MKFRMRLTGGKLTGFRPYPMVWNLAGFRQCLMGWDLTGFRQRLTRRGMAGFRQHLTEGYLAGFRQHLTGRNLTGFKQRLTGRNLTGFRQCFMGRHLAEFGQRPIVWYIMGLLLCLTVAGAVRPTAVLAAEAEWPSGVEIEADGAILMEKETGTILYEKNKNTAYYPASITKLLTAQVVLDHADINEVVTFSREAVHNVEEGSKSLGMAAGDRMTVKDCLYGLLLYSANEVANALAEHTAGSVDEFVRLMNEKAAELGCTQSHFANPSGLNDPEHYTTAYDMALIARKALDYPDIVAIMGTGIYRIPPTKNNPEGVAVSPGHKMQKKSQAEYDPAVFGGKTGYTSLAGNTLVTYAEKDGMTLIAVVLNGHLSHYRDTKLLLDFGFQNFQAYRLNEFDTVYHSLTDDLSFAGLESGQPLLSLHERSSLILPKEAELSAVARSVVYDTTLWTPENVLVTVDYLYGGKPAGHAWFTASPGVEALRLDFIPSVSENRILTGEKLKEYTGKILPFLLVLLAAASGMAVRHRKGRELKDAAVRKQLREQKMRESGCSAEELEHLLSEGGTPRSSKKRGR